MLILAIETATELSSLALSDDDRELAAWREITHEDLCRRLAAEAGRLLQRAGRSFSDLDLIAVGLGPGSFTSLRVGLATAKAFAFALDRPLVGVSSLAAMAWQARDQASGLLCPLTDARRGELYGAVYRVTGAGIEPVVPEFVATPEQLPEKLLADGHPVTIIGQVGLPAVEQAVAALGGRAGLAGDQPLLPDALAVAQLALRRYRERGADEVAPLRPIYVRMSYAEEAAHLDLGLR